MSDEDKVAALDGVAALATMSALDPTGGVASAMLTHAITNMSIDSAWRGQVLDLWLEIVAEGQEERRRQYRETQAEFHRHRLIVDWLKDELADVLGRVETLEGVVLGMLAQSEYLLRLRPEPEMRPYLVAAFANATRRRDRFPPTWVRRLTKLLEEFGLEHIKLLEELAAEGEPGGWITREREWWDENGISGTGVALAELETASLISRPRSYQGTAGEKWLGQGCILVLGIRLLEFVTPPPK